MAKKKKAQECPAGEKWAVPYADFLSLLLALFIALWAISDSSQSKTEALKVEFIKIFDFPRTDPVESLDEASSSEEGGKGEESVVSAETVENVMQLENMTQEGGLLEQVDAGTILRLPASLLFERGSADVIDSDSYLYVTRLSNMLKKMPSSVKIDVRGYTDNASLPIGSKFKDNYELSAMRGLSVAKELIKNGIDSTRVSFSGYGSNAPAFPNDSEQNRAKNNRAEIFLFVNNENVKAVESVLEELAKEHQESIKTLQNTPAPKFDFTKDDPTKKQESIDKSKLEKLKNSLPE